MVRKLKIPTKHGEISTPSFMPDATYGAINSLTFDDLLSTNIEQIVTTTLHLELKLGSEYIEKYGGIHKFFNWDRPILTDSGGFQVFSLVHRNQSKSNKVSNEGVDFVDYTTGNKFLLTPENSQQIQHRLNSDIRVVLDEPIPPNSDRTLNESSVSRTTQWAQRSKAEFLRLNNLSTEEFTTTDGRQRPLLTAVIQGDNFRDLRKSSAEALIEIGFDGYNLGGLTQTEDGKLDIELCEYVANLIPENKIRYAMGVGTPDDIVTLANQGWDLFDCVLPTRNARHGYLYVPAGEGDDDHENYSALHIKTERYKYADAPLSSDTHPALKNISRAYLRHLFKVKEPSAWRIATLHNLHFYSQLVKKIC